MSALDNARAWLARWDHAEWKPAVPFGGDIVRDLIAEHERLTAPPTDDEREVLARIINPLAWEKPLLPETYRAGERDSSLRRADTALAAGFRRLHHGPITDEMVTAALARFNQDAPSYRARMRAALEAAREVQS